VRNFVKTVFIDESSFCDIVVGVLNFQVEKIDFIDRSIGCANLGENTLDSTSFRRIRVVIPFFITGIFTSSVQAIISRISGDLSPSIVSLRKTC
jgi:hypothetical protein